MLVNTFLLEEIGIDVLLGNNIIIVYQIILDNSKCQILLSRKDSTKIIIDTIIHEKKQVKLLLVRVKESYKILVGSHQTIEIYLPKLLPPSQNYMFTSTKKGMPNRYLGAKVKIVLFTNLTQETIVLKKGTTLGTISSISKGKMESTQVQDKATKEIKSFFGIYRSCKPIGKLAKLAKFATTCLVAIAILIAKVFIGKSKLIARMPTILVPLDKEY